MLQQTIQRLTDQFVSDFFSALRNTAMGHVLDVTRPAKQPVAQDHCARCNRPLSQKEQAHTRCPKCLKKHASEQRVRDTKRRQAERDARAKAKVPANSQVRLAS